MLSWLLSAAVFIGFIWLAHLLTPCRECKGTGVVYDQVDEITGYRYRIPCANCGRKPRKGKQ